MTAIPLLQIIFYLATAFLPSGTSQFTVSSGYNHKITWVQQAGGAWKATDEAGQELGTWSLSGPSVTVVDHGTTNKTDLSDWVENEEPANQKKQMSLRGRSVTTTLTNSSLTFSQDRGGLLSKPVVVTFGRN